jgi:formamidopyrimidine-DNA glycosylase
VPELPEVETVRRGLEPVLVGAAFARVEQRRADLRVPFPERFPERLEGRRILGLRRRAKYLLAQLDSGEVLAMHLGMSGAFTIRQPGREPCGMGEFLHTRGRDPRHDHVVFTLSNGITVTYNDARRFGSMALVPEPELEEHPSFRSLGVEPLGNELDAHYLARAAHERRTDLKAFLMDQRIVAGLGNIYVCEALFRARLSPLRGAASLTTRSGRPTARAERLVLSIRTVLEDAITAGGSSIRTYAAADGSPGAFQDAFDVYGREGEPCLRPGCRGTVRRSTQGGRSSFFCPSCQR